MASVVSLVPFQKVILEPTNLVRPFRIGSLAYAGAHWLRDVLELGGWRAAVVCSGPSPKFSLGKVPQPVVRCSGPGLTGRKGGGPVVAQAGLEGPVRGAYRVPAGPRPFTDPALLGSLNCVSGAQIRRGTPHQPFWDDLGYGLAYLGLTILLVLVSPEPGLTSPTHTTIHTGTYIIRLDRPSGAVLGRSHACTDAADRIVDCVWDPGAAVGVRWPRDRLAW